MSGRAGHGFEIEIEMVGMGLSKDSAGIRERGRDKAGQGSVLGQGAGQGEAGPGKGQGAGQGKGQAPSMRTKFSDMSEEFSCGTKAGISLPCPWPKGVHFGVHCSEGGRPGRGRTCAPAS